MSQSQAELTLLISAKNLSEGVIKNFQGSLGKVAGAAEAAGGRITGAFRSVSSGVVNGLGNLTETLAQGGGLGEAAFMFGAYMAGQAAEAFLEHMIERLAESSLLAAIGAPISAAFSALGSLMSSAIAIGMAAFPVVLLGLLIAAIVFLVNNPEIVNKIAEFVGGLIDNIVKGLGALGDFLVTAFGVAWQMVVDAVEWYVTNVVGFWLSIPGRLLSLGGTIVTTIIDGLASFPGKLADIIRRAFQNLRIDVGPFHISGAHGITIDLPTFAPGSHFNTPGGGTGKGNAGGGWVGMYGPEIVRVGEQGPEYVNRAGRDSAAAAGGSGMMVRIEGVSRSELVDMVDRELYVRLLRAAPTSTKA